MTDHDHAEHLADVLIREGMKGANYQPPEAFVSLAECYVEARRQWEAHEEIAAEKRVENADLRERLERAEKDAYSLRRLLEVAERERNEEKTDTEEPGDHGYSCGPVPDKPWMVRIWRTATHFVEDVHRDRAQERLAELIGEVDTDGTK